MQVRSKEERTCVVEREREKRKWNEEAIPPTREIHRIWMHCYESVVYMGLGEVVREE